MDWLIVVSERKMYIIPNDFEHTAGVHPGDILPCAFPTHQAADIWLKKIRRTAIEEFHITMKMKDVLLKKLTNQDET